MCTQRYEKCVAKITRKKKKGGKRKRKHVKEQVGNRYKSDRHVKKEREKDRGKKDMPKRSAMEREKTLRKIQASVLWFPPYQ